MQAHPLSVRAASHYRALLAAAATPRTLPGLLGPLCDAPGTHTRLRPQAWRGSQSGGVLGGTDPRAIVHQAAPDGGHRLHGGSCTAGSNRVTFHADYFKQVWVYLILFHLKLLNTLDAQH